MDKSGTWSRLLERSKNPEDWGPKSPQRVKELLLLIEAKMFQDMAAGHLTFHLRQRTPSSNLIKTSTLLANITTTISWLALSCVFPPSTDDTKTKTVVLRHRVPAHAS